jgi:hypothetical protein
MIAGPSADWLGISLIFCTPLISVFSFTIFLGTASFHFCEAVQALIGPIVGWDLVGTNRSAFGLVYRK